MNQSAVPAQLEVHDLHLKKQIHTQRPTAELLSVLGDSSGIEGVESEQCVCQACNLASIQNGTLTANKSCF